MHIHGSHININAVNPYSAAAEKAIAAQRAANVRKKLKKSAANIEGASSPEEALMIDQWTDPHRSLVMSPAQSEDRYYPGNSGKDPDFA